MRMRTQYRQAGLPFFNEGWEGRLEKDGRGRTRGLSGYRNEMCKRDMRLAFAKWILHETGLREEDEDSSCGAESV
jgi:hypothetical protein